MLNALPSVDSFFLMGGTLTAYIVFKELDKAGANVGRSEISVSVKEGVKYSELPTSGLSTSRQS